MAESGSTASRAPRSVGGRLRFAWRALPPERRLAALAAVALFVTLFLPWYQETVIPTGFAAHSSLPSATLTGWAAFSFVEAAVLLVSLSVLALLFFRAEGRAFHVPGGDGGVITGAGFWTGVLILWRMFDKSGTQGHGQFVTTSGIEWGIFIALAIAGLLAYAGQRIRLLRAPEPPLPGERPGSGPGPGGSRRARRTRSRAGGRERSRPGDADPEDGWVTPDSHGPGATARRPPIAGRPAAPPATRAYPADPATEPHPEDPPTQSRGGAPHGLSRSEAQAIGLDDPPEPPTVRRLTAPDSRLSGPGPGLTGPDDQLTIPLENPE